MISQWSDFESPFCASRMLVDPHDGGIEDQIFEIRIVRQRRENALSDAACAPPVEAHEDAVPFAKTAGRSRQGEPVRPIHSTASTNMRLSAPVPPGFAGSPTHNFSMCFHCGSLKTSRISSCKTASSESAVLNHKSIPA